METDENQFFFQHDLTWENMYGWIDGDKLVSTYTSLPGKVKIRKKEYSARMIEYVATLPTYRQKGLVSKMMIDEMSRCYSEGIPVILLDPFKHSYYRQFNFETAMDKNLLKIDWELLSDYLNCQGYEVKMDYLKDSCLKDDYQKVRQWLWEHSLYNEIKMIQPAEEVKFYNKDKMIAVAYNQQQEPEGYLIYAQEGRTLNVDYYRYTSLAAFFALKKLILSYQDQVNKLVLKKIPKDFPLDLLLDNYWQGGKDMDLLTYPSKMMRIINVEQMLQSLFIEKQNQEITLQINDPIIAHNNSCFAFKNSKVSKIDNCNRVDLLVNISDLSSLLTGRRTASELYQLGKLNIPGNEQNIRTGFYPEIIQIFDRFFPRQVTFNGDEW